ncbi:hypothetical protein [Phycicoccus sp. Soil802]|uniref:hypothetical protein n=1 Tax=Phycicoccus sp. Soil802 TaxID=1736414 RepID=UPI0007034583|nr:hypothetical protein [Phycicoccus sp. Soil802]KRF29467.1 hypothetical protein ASG91_00060 [Phycicoccus sp. Soil802]
MPALPCTAATASRPPGGEKPADPQPNDNAAIAQPPQANEIALSAALKVIGNHAERQGWLEDMQRPAGMAPGSTARAHARAFRFADALRRVGYQITEAPLGPRGGRRFTLDRYDGPRAGQIFRLKELRSCGMRHLPDECDCFDGLTDDEIQVVRRLHRSLAKTWGRCYGTDTLAHIVQRYDAQTVTDAVYIYIEGNKARASGTTLEELLEAVKAAHQ